MKNNVQSIHFVGIQGVGMTALALLCRDQGKKVTGSDVAEEFDTHVQLTSRGITVYRGFSPKHVHTDMVVYTGAHGGELNEEVVYAASQGIYVMSLAHALGELSKLKKTLGICGCHGKTTTTALASYVLSHCLSDVSYVVGASTFSGLAPGHWSERSDLFVVEADEYVIDPQTDKRPKFALLSAQFVIATTFDYDHVDMYASVDALKQAYREFFLSIPATGLVIVNADDTSLCSLVKGISAHVVTYGTSTKADYRVSEIHRSNSTTVFTVHGKNNFHEQYTCNLHGLHNAVNATSVIAFCNEQGIDITLCKKAISMFSGVRRRLEKQYDKDSITLFDDYAHHPSEIAATLDAVVSSYPERSVAILFQPHTYSRTKYFLKDFAQALSQADYVGLLPIFASKRESSDDSVSSKNIVNVVQIKNKAMFTCIENRTELTSWLKKLPKEKLVVLTLGAGNVYRYVEKIVQFFTNDEH